jgi:hypothetical protein
MGDRSNESGLFRWNGHHRNRGPADHPLGRAAGVSDPIDPAPPVCPHNDHIDIASDTHSGRSWGGFGEMRWLGC